jgi:type III pantothenate kinase
MILELDMGNTRIKWRLLNGSSKVAHGNMSSQAAWSDLGLQLGKATKNNALAGNFPLTLKQIRVVSVLGENQYQSFLAWSQEAYGIQPDFAVSQLMAAGVINGYERPEQLGVDRWLAILAGFARAKRATVIVDCGSAVTLDLVSARGEHLGGYIGPGLTLMRRALLGNIEKVKITDATTRLMLSPGRNTEAAVTAAQSAMLVGLVKQAVLELQSAGEKPALMITGGDAEVLLPFFPEAIFLPELVLDGLALAIPYS